MQLSACLALCLVIIVLLLWLVAPKAEHVTCRSDAAIAAAQNYYNTVGDYHGIFTMDPISATQVADDVCDIKYVYVPTPGSPRNDSRVDFRRFTYDGSNVVLMGDWMSGQMAKT
jgi:hypothetical protein